MTIIVDTIFSYLPFKRKQTPSGWISFNAVCCDDQRHRGGIIQNGDSFSYHCFNCGFKTSWQPGRNFTLKMKKFLKLLNIPDDTINKLALDALRHKDIEEIRQVTPRVEFGRRELPLGSLRIKDAIDDMPNELLPIIEYIYNRGLTIDDYDFYWTPEEGFNNRLIIPYYYKGTIVGYAGRRIDNGKPKYLAEQQPGYVFNLDRQHEDRKFVIVCEGQLDAISIDSVAVLGSEISQPQCQLIQQLNKKVIVVPDRDSAGKKLVNYALEYGWSVSYPEWDPKIKDINDSVKKYGRIETLLNIQNHTESFDVKIKLKAKEWFKELY